jgi:hypothetical protein
MIYLYYTGAKENDGVQTEIQKSLGGYISSSIIPNASLNSLFRDLSEFSKIKNSSEVICVAIKNTLLTPLENFTFYINGLDASIDVKAAFVVPTTDSCGNKVFESIKTQEQLPYYAEFENVDGEDNAINIGQFPANSFLGLFLQKIITPESEQCTAVNFSTITEQEKTQSLDLVFSWD